MAKKRYDPKRVPKAIGLKIRQLRNEKGWTLEQCEEHGWPNWRYLQAIESGQNVTSRTLAAIANLFGISLSELFKDL